VLQVSAGVDSSGHAAAFALSAGGSLDEYAYVKVLYGFGIWAKSHEANSVSAFSASQVQSNTVDYFVIPG